MKPSRDRRIMPEGSSNFLELRNKLLEAERYRQAGKLDSAQSICSRLVVQYPDFAAALHTLGLILADQSQHLEALSLLTRAAMHNPDNWSIQTALGVAYLSLGATELAEQSLERAKSLSPDQASIYASLGELHRDRQEFELAAKAFELAGELDPGLTAAYSGLGMALIHLGRLAEAAKALEKSLAQTPSNLNTLLVLAGLPGDLVEFDLLSIIPTLRAKSATPRQEAKIAFIRAAALNQRGKYAEAWSAFTIANKIMFGEMEPAWKKQREHDQWFSEHLRSLPVIKAVTNHSGEENPTSLFILGPSRVGKTTAELLTSTIPGVKRGFENLIVEKSVERSFQEAALPPRDQLKDLPSGLETQFRNQYLGRLRRAAGGHSVFTITHPGRMLDALRLAALLPSARFILLKRNADDLTVRIFMKMFLKGHPYAYSLRSIRAYVQSYYEVLDVIAEKLPGRTVAVNYEEMIAAPERTRDVIGKFCGLAPARSPVPILGNDLGCAKLYPLSEEALDT